MTTDRMVERVEKGKDLLHDRRIGDGLKKDRKNERRQEVREHKNSKKNKFPCH